VLGIHVGAVKTRLHKARDALQRQLLDLWTEDLMTTTNVGQDMVQMRVVDVRRREGSEENALSVVLLEEVGGSRQLPIGIGQWESDSIAMLLEKVKVPRPLTYAFTASLLRAGGIQVAVRVHRLAEETYYAQVVVRGPGGEQAVDCRPSDCIALALEVGAPIYVAGEVLTAAEDARRSRVEPDQPVPTLGAAEIVTGIIERWPREPKPSWTPQAAAPRP
jgi:bifunctional DNase/RNase